MTIQSKKLSSTQTFEEVLEAVQPMITSIITKLQIYKDFDSYRQIASIAVWKAWLKAQPAKGQFSAFIYSSIKGEILNELSKEKNYLERITVVEDETLHYMLSERERGESQKSPDYLECILTQLEQGERNIILLYYVAGYNDREIADILDLSIAVSKKRRMRVIKRLRDQIFQVE
ncbi:sigma-70 family RNA polymerase sigma factor [Lysinibacillus irui]|uniref:sigma-70 family RNA polymerase sigma factor n=1 Tax=Lysinibacillus irui TaxID=2998077 RepID=UPI004043C29D